MTLIERRPDRRGIAIVAHVDHGKTTLVDAMLQQSGLFREDQDVQDCVLDSGDLERERGITILSKNTAVRCGDVVINIVDTPGHRDFGAEVERILTMVEGVLLLVDAAEGPLPQTRFVLRKALEGDKRVIVLINKIDRPDARVDEVEEEIQDLFLSLAERDEDLDFQVLYGSGRLGFASDDQNATEGDLTPLFRAIVDLVPAPVIHAGEFSMRVAAIDHNEYVGRLAIGRIHSGVLKKGTELISLDPDGKNTGRGRVSRVELFDGLGRKGVESASAGDIVVIAGLPEVEIASTLARPGTTEPLPGPPIDEPTLAMEVRVNDSPFAGLGGKFLTSRHLRERLLREAEKNVGIRLRQTAEPDVFEVLARGELSMAILAETMRREGYELALGRPRVLTHEGPNGETLEPWEEAVIDCADEHSGAVIQAVGERGGELVHMGRHGDRTRLDFNVPSRGLLGFRTELLTLTRGTAIFHHLFDHWGTVKGVIAKRSRGALIAKEKGEVTTYALDQLSQRGTFFVKPGDNVYPGQIVGENVKEGDLVVQVCRKKQLTNVRSSTSDIAVRLTPPRNLDVDLAIEWIAPDELVEVAPGSLRLRKRMLSEIARLRAR